MVLKHSKGSVRFDRIMTFIFFTLVICFVVISMLLLKYVNMNDRNIANDAELIKQNTYSIVLINKKLDAMLNHFKIQVEEHEQLKDDIKELQQEVKE